MFRPCWLWIFFLLVSVVSCNFYVSKDSMSDTGSGGAGSGQAGFAVPTYSYVQAQVFQPYCITCHSSAGGNPSGVNLETYSKTIQNLSNIETVALITHVMPPSSPLPSFAQNILKEWTDGGAPLNGVAGPPSGVSPTPIQHPSPTPSPGPGASPTASPGIQATYQSLAQNIFTPKCIVCHSAGGVQSSRPLDSYQSIMNGGWVKAGSPTGSTLYQVISDGKMPPGSPLSQADIQAVSTWISNGAQNN